MAERTESGCSDECEMKRNKLLKIGKEKEIKNII